MSSASGGPVSLSWMGHLRRQVARTLLHAGFRVFQRHRHTRPVVEEVAGRPIIVLPGVMNPVLFRTGEVLAGLLSTEWIPEGSTVLDMGTGSGVCAVLAAQWADGVVAVDVNPQAVRCARINALLNEVDHEVEVREGDLFEPVRGERFDVVLFNPPFLSGAPKTESELALRSPGILRRFAAGLGDHLRDDGTALVLLSSIGDEGEHLRTLRARGLTVEAIRRRNVFAETLTLYRIRPAPATEPGAVS